MSNFIIITYHDIVTHSYASTNDVSVSDFINHMSLIKKMRLSVLSLSDISRLYANRTLPSRNSIALTFDDGYLGNVRYVMPEIIRQNFPATFFVHTDYIGVKTERFHISWEDIKEMASVPGIEVQSHSKSHPDLTTLSPHQLKLELKYSRQKLFEVLGTDQYAFAYPFGRFNRDVISNLRGIYRLAFTSSADTKGIYTIPRIKINSLNRSPAAFKKLLEITFNS